MTLQDQLQLARLNDDQVRIFAQDAEPRPDRLLPGAEASLRMLKSLFEQKPVAGVAERPPTHSEQAS